MTKVNVNVLTMKEKHLEIRSHAHVPVGQGAVDNIVRIRGADDSVDGQPHQLREIASHCIPEGSESERMTCGNHHRSS